MNEELSLKGLKQVVLDNFDFHILRNLLVKLILSQEGIWGVLEIPQSISPPLIDDFTGNRTHKQRKQGQRPNHNTIETTSRFVFIFIGFIQHSHI